MTKRIIASATAASIVIAASLVFAFALAFPIEARAAEQATSALQAESVHAVKPAASYDVEVEYDGESFYQGTGVTWVYDLRDLMSNYFYEDESIDIISASGSGAVSYDESDYDGRFSITALRAGSVTLTCRGTWDEYDSYSHTYRQQTELRSFVINAISLDNTSGVVTKCTTGSTYSTYTSASFTFNISGLPADKSAVEWVSDSSTSGRSYVESVAAGQVTLYVYGTGTHTIQLRAYGKDITCVAALRLLGLKKTAAVKNTGSLVTYPKQKNTLKVSLTGVSNPKVTWSTTNSKIASVSKKGVVKAKKKGRCYIRANVDGGTLKVLVEVTSKKACKAVSNGFKDMKTKIKYSQPNRMGAKCRDCSSFVSRCYWDTSLGRKLTLIGGSGASGWAYNAAGQAQWLNGAGKRVAWKACSTSKLRPGDTIYFETDYAGKDSSQWRYIDHAALYVGNGYILQTGGYGGKGNVGISSYWPKDKRVKFIGRPCS